MVSKTFSSTPKRNSIGDNNRPNFHWLKNLLSCNNPNKILGSVQPNRSDFREPPSGTTYLNKLEIMTNGSTAEQAIKDPFCLKYFRPSEPLALYHKKFLDTNNEYNINDLHLQIQKGRTCQGNAIYTCLKFTKNSTLDKLFPNPSKNDRHNFAKLIFNNCGANMNSINSLMKEHQINLIVINKDHSFNSRSDHLKSLLNDGSAVNIIIGGVFGEDWIDSEQENLQTHAIAILGYIESEKSFVVADSNNRHNELSLLHEKIVDKVSYYPWRQFETD